MQALKESKVTMGNVHAPLLTLYLDHLALLVTLVMLG